MANKTNSLPVPNHDIVKNFKNAKGVNLDIFTLPEFQALKPKQQSFVLEILVNSDISLTKAAEKAGYHPEYGKQLVHLDHIAKAITAARNLSLQQSGITTATVINNLTLLYRKAEKQDNIPAATKILELLGKHTGAFQADHGGQPGQNISVTMNFNYTQNNVSGGND